MEEEQRTVEEGAGPTEGDTPAAEASLDEIIATQKPAEAGEEEAEEDPLLTGREDRVEPLPAKVVPQQPTEFVCKSCFLVKHQSQLADKKRMYCRDCV